MADDANLARLVLAVERSGASLVLVGDHRQLAAVGPGGALAALLDRRPDLVVTLDENVRQHDPAERQALAELRDGVRRRRGRLVRATTDASTRSRTGSTRSSR